MQYCWTRFDCTNFSTARRASWSPARVTNESCLTFVPLDGDCEHLVQPILGSKPDAIALPYPVKLGDSLVLLTSWCGLYLCSCIPWKEWIPSIVFAPLWAVPHSFFCFAVTISVNHDFAFVSFGLHSTSIHVVCQLLVKFCRLLSVIRSMLSTKHRLHGRLPLKKMDMWKSGRVFKMMFSKKI